MEVIQYVRLGHEITTGKALKAVVEKLTTGSKSYNIKLSMKPPHKGNYSTSITVETSH